jgi:tetratricopeptide (TPR) repeat protein
VSRFGNLEFGDDMQQKSETPAVMKDEDYYLREAVGFFQKGRFEQALRSYAKILEFNPKHAGAWTGQVRMLIELGEYREAALWADKALQMFAQDADLLAAKAVALARGGDTDGAMSFSDASVEEQGDSPYVWLARADVLLARKEKRADYCFEKALGKSRDGWLTRWLAARILHFYKQTVKALKLLQDALNLDSAQPVIWQELGRCQITLGMIAQSRSSFEHALELDPDSPETEAEIARNREVGLLTRLQGAWRQLFAP